MNKSISLIASIFILLIVANENLKADYGDKTPVKDALKLSEAIDKTPKDENVIGTILCNYANVNDTITKSDFELIFKNNMFLMQYENDFFPDDAKMLPNVNSNQKNELRAYNLSVVSETPSNITGLSVPSITKGIAGFLLERAKEEMIMDFINHFKKLLKQKNFWVLQTLLPNTYKYIVQKDDIFNNFDFSLKAIKDLLEKDITDLPQNTNNVIDTIIRRDYVDIETKKTLTYVSVFLNFIVEISKKNNPIVALKNTISDPDRFKNNVNLDPNFKSCLNLLYLILANTRDSSKSENIWVKKNEIEKLITDKKALMIFIGLVYQSDTAFFNSIIFNGELFINKTDIDAEQINKFGNLLADMITIGEEVDNILKEFKTQKENNEKIETADYIRYTEKCTVLLTKILDTKSLIDNKQVLNKVEVEDYIFYGNKIYDVWSEIEQKKYGIAIANSFILVDAVIEKFSDSNKVEKESFENIRDKVIMYSTFIAALIDAKSSSDVENAIESAVLPLGSSSVKRNSTFNFGLNAYVGLFLGTSGVKDSHFSGDFGITTPIGIEGSWMLGKNWSISGFVPLFDLGGVISVKAYNDTTVSQPDFGLKDLFSPGLYVMLGAPYSISGGFGLQWGPLFYKNETEIQKQRLFRISFFIAVDIPLFNFKTIP